jgi:ABC-type nitrate/sulfonate/bicarbonate transport system ATPase subunit
MARVELKGISRKYRVDNVNIVIEGEFVALVGPPGCGNSALIRMIAGLDDITEGELLIDGEIMNDVPPEDRNVAAVWDNHNQYPDMLVYEFMAYDLEEREAPKDEIDRRISVAAPILGLEKFLDKKLKALSGDWRQRVAIGRAIIRNPKVLLFDSPLSYVDAELRAQMCAELPKRINDIFHGIGSSRYKVAIIYSTCDQAEAMSMADRIVMMKDGKVQQIIKVPKEGGRAKLVEEYAKSVKGSAASGIPFYAYQGDAPYVFVSYAHADSNKFFPILSEFHNAGFPVWYDEGIDPGNEWPEEIANALVKCSLFVVFISNSSAASGNVRNEIILALSENKPFIAIWLEDASLSPGMKLQIGSKQGVMYFKMSPEDFYRKCFQSFGSLGNKKIDQ